MSQQHDGGESNPAIFDPRSFSEAEADATKSGRWFIVFAHAGRRGPTRRMLDETWNSAVLPDLLKAHAIFTAIDVDQQSAWATEHEIVAVPTTLAFKESREFDRVIGFQTAKQLFSWILRLPQSIDESVARRGPTSANPTIDVDAKYRAAEAMIDARKYAEAAEEFAWLWDHMVEHQPSMHGVRVSFMAGKMKSLAGLDAMARERFRALRDRIAATVGNVPPRRELVHDWIVLNEVVQEEDRTLAWFDLVKEQPVWRVILRGEIHNLQPQLQREGRQRDAGGLIDDPVSELERELELHRSSNSMLARMPADRAESLKSHSAQRIRERSGWLYACMLAAGRDADATRLVARARAADPDRKMVEAIVRGALDARQPRAQLLDWLQEFSDGSLDWLKPDVEAALRGDRPTSS